MWNWMKQNWVIVDDDVATLESLKNGLSTQYSHNAHIECFSAPMDALLYCQKNPPSIIICDLRQPELAGLKLLKAIKNLNQNCHCLLLCASHTVEENTHVQNLEYVDSYLAKPWSTDEVLQHIKRLIKNFPTSPAHDEYTSFHNIISHSQNMYDIFKCIRRLATNNVPIFICGETGTGKELIAKACHSESSRNEQPFVAVNCANFTESLMETQLFGHKKGAFTGAINDQAGLFSLAKTGTLFLDEVTTIPIGLQAKLLRVIQEREFNPVGSHKSEKFHAQLITASSKTLRQAVDDGEFREDLFYRLNVIYIQLPPLRDRNEDIKLLSQHYLAKFSEETHKEFNNLSDYDIKQLENYDWPGNIRQLENFIHCLVILNDGPNITAAMIKDAIQLIQDSPQQKTPKKNIKNVHELKTNRTEVGQDNSEYNDKNNQNLKVKPLWLIEKDHIESTIEMCNGNVYKAAALLEISPSTIYRKQQSWKTK